MGEKKYPQACLQPYNIEWLLTCYCLIEETLHINTNGCKTQKKIQCKYAELTGTDKKMKCDFRILVWAAQIIRGVI